MLRVLQHTIYYYITTVKCLHERNKVSVGRERGVVWLSRECGFKQELPPIQAKNYHLAALGRV